MNVPVCDWGRRLSDAVRVALEAADLASARRLVLDGDGQARSLAREYTFMVRGLGITIRVLLRLLGESAGRFDPSRAAATTRALTSTIRSFRHDLARCTTLDAAAGPAPAEDPASLEQELAWTAQALLESEARFERGQALEADEVVRAIDASHAEQALALLDWKERGQYLPLHDALIRFMADAFAWVLEHQGTRELMRDQGRSRSARNACPCTAHTARSGTAPRRSAGSAARTGCSRGRRALTVPAPSTSTSGGTRLPRSMPPGWRSRWRRAEWSGSTAPSR